MDLRKRAFNIRQTIESLEPRDYYLVSIDNERLGTTAGCTVCMSRERAAQAIIDATHRLATPEEIEDHELDQRRKGELIRQAEIESRFPLNLKVYSGNDPKAERDTTSRTSKKSQEKSQE